MISHRRRVMNLSHVLHQAARRFPDRTGLVWGDEEVLSWGEIDRRVDAMCAALAARGLSKGDRVLVQSKNCPQMFESMFVCFRLGAVWAPTNFRQTPDEVAYLAQASGARLMICHADFLEHAKACQQASSSLLDVVFIGPHGDDPHYEALVARHRGESVLAAAVEHDDPCWFFFTSGSTGRPKAAVLTHGQMGFVITNHLCDLVPGTTPEDASLAVAPLSHGAGIHQLVQTARAVKTILPASERLDPAEIWALIERWRVTNIFTVPTILKLLIEHPAVDRRDHSCLRYVIYAGSPMYREDQKRALDKLGAVLVQYYGMGEVTGNITVLAPALHDADDRTNLKLNTCGVERTAMHISIQDDTGQELPPGANGEICVCGLAVFAGYYNNPEANRQAFRNGWFRTGDLGYMDAEGFVYITGRASDMYISGGSNVYPREIEEKMLQHPLVAEAAIVGAPDAIWGEVGVGVCVLRAGGAVSEDELLEWLKGKVARYKMPKRIFFWDALPKSAYGKITKKIMRDALAQQGHLPLNLPGKNA